MHAKPLNKQTFLYIFYTRSDLAVTFQLTDRQKNKQASMRKTF